MQWASVYDAGKSNSSVNQILKLLPQLALEHLAIGVARQRRAADDAAYTLLLSEPRIGPLGELRGIQRAGRQGYYHRHRRLAPLNAAYTHHGNVGYLRVHAHHGFDVRRIDVLAAGQDHIFLAVYDIEEAIRIQPPQVSGSQPAPPCAVRPS